MKVAEIKLTVIALTDEERRRMAVALYYASLDKNRSSQYREDCAELYRKLIPRTSR